MEIQEVGAAVVVTANIKKRMGKGADIRDGPGGSSCTYTCALPLDTLG